MKLSKTFTTIIKDHLTFTGALTIVFIALKVTNNIDWSWFWVFTPMWGKLFVEIFLGLLMDVFDEVEDEMKKGE